MKLASKFVIGITMLGVIGVVAYRYHQYIGEHNYLMIANVPCDPSTEGTCFVADCDPEQDEECDQAPYKKAELLASEAPACVAEHQCEAFSCDGIESCTMSYCQDDTLEDGERCFEVEQSEPEEETIGTNEAATIEE